MTHRIYDICCEKNKFEEKMHDGERLNKAIRVSRVQSTVHYIAILKFGKKKNEKNKNKTK